MPNSSMIEKMVTISIDGLSCKDIQRDKSTMWQRVSSYSALPEILVALIQQLTGCSHQQLYKYGHTHP